LESGGCAVNLDLLVAKVTDNGWFVPAGELAVDKLGEETSLPHAAITEKEDFQHCPLNSARES
jgi:hypothetical protein